MRRIGSVLLLNLLLLQCLVPGSQAQPIQNTQKISSINLFTYVDYNTSAPSDSFGWKLEADIITIPPADPYTLGVKLQIPSTKRSTEYSTRLLQLVQTIVNTGSKGLSNMIHRKLTSQAKLVLESLWSANVESEIFSSNIAALGKLIYTGFKEILDNGDYKTESSYQGWKTSIVGAIGIDYSTVALDSKKFHHNSKLGDLTRSRLSILKSGLAANQSSKCHERALTFICSQKIYDDISAVDSEIEKIFLNSRTAFTKQTAIYLLSAEKQLSNKEIYNEVIKRISKLIGDLSPEVQSSVNSFIKYLIEQRAKGLTINSADDPKLNQLATTVVEEVINNPSIVSIKQSDPAAVTDQVLGSVGIASVAFQTLTRAAVQRIGAPIAIVASVNLIATVMLAAAFLTGVVGPSSHQPSIDSSKLATIIYKEYGPIMAPVSTVVTDAIRNTSPKLRDEFADQLLSILMGLLTMPVSNCNDVNRIAFLTSNTIISAKIATHNAGNPPFPYTYTSSISQGPMPEYSFHSNKILGNLIHNMTQGRIYTDPYINALCSSYIEDSLINDNIPSSVFFDEAIIPYPGNYSLTGAIDWGLNIATTFLVIAGVVL